MNIVVRKLILFLIMFTIVYIGYYFLVIRPYNKQNDSKKKRKKKNNEDRVEIQYLVNKYKIDIKNINMNNLLWDIAFTNSFIIALTVVVIGLDIISSYVWKILIGFIVLIPSILLGYKILSIKYTKEKRK